MLESTPYTNCSFCPPGLNRGILIPIQTNPDPETYKLECTSCKTHFESTLSKFVISNLRHKVKTKSLLKYHTHHRYKLDLEILLIFHEILEGTFKDKYLVSIKSATTGTCLPYPSLRLLGEAIAICLYPPESDGKTIQGTTGSMHYIDQPLVLNQDLMQSLQSEWERWKDTPTSNIFFMRLGKGNIESSFASATYAIEKLEEKPWLIPSVAEVMKESLPDLSVQDIIAWIKTKYQLSN